jgi:hypothetical protein
MFIKKKLAIVEQEGPRRCDGVKIAEDRGGGLERIRPSGQPNPKLVSGGPSAPGCSLSVIMSCSRPS